MIQHLQIVSFSSLANVLLKSFPILLQRFKNTLTFSRDIKHICLHSYTDQLDLYDLLIMIFAPCYDKYAPEQYLHGDLICIPL